MAGTETFDADGFYRTGDGMDLVTSGDNSITAEDATFFDPHVSMA